MKVDRGNYGKMKNLLGDRSTCEKVSKPPFKTIERELNQRLIQLKRKEKLDEHTYKKLHSTDAIPLAIRESVKYYKPNNPLRTIVAAETCSF